MALSPFVYWAQTESNISLTVDLKNVKRPDIQLIEDEIEFSAIGSGAKGPNEYHFVLEFYLPVDPQASQTRVTDRQVEFNIVKQEKAWWPRLTFDQKKPTWLKIDFDKWQADDEDEDNDNGDMEDFKGMNPELDELIEKMKNEKVDFPKVDDLRKLYLLLYNMIQLIGFVYMLCKLIHLYTDENADFSEKTYESIGGTMKFCIALQLLEIVHPLLGFTKGGFLQPAVQACGRWFIVFIMIGSEPRMQTKPVVFYLFSIYSTIEVIRYPYYMLKIINKESSLVTWFRYTIWIPLYPLGFLCEGIIILRNIPYFEETKKYTLSLPNKMNISFDLPLTLRVYLLFLCFPVMYFLMTHMYRQRVKLLGPANRKKKNKF